MSASEGSRVDTQRNYMCVCVCARPLSCNKISFRNWERPLEGAGQRGFNTFSRAQNTSRGKGMEGGGCGKGRFQ